MTAAEYACARVISAATTSNCTIAAMSQQHEEASVALQGTPFTLAMLRGTTGETLMVPTPIAAAAHVAKVVDRTDAASTPHSCSSAWTSSQVYEGLGAVAGTVPTAGVGASAADVAAGVGVGVAAGVAVAAGGVTAEVGAGVATGIVTAGVGVGVATGAGA